MAYTARQLITRSFYLSGIVGRNLQVPTGEQITYGLDLLNALLDSKSVDLDLIPYYSYNTSVTCVPGQESYFIENCLLIESLTFNISNVRYATDFITRRNYFGSSRVNNIQTLPFSWTYNRKKGGGTLYLYFIPDQAYPLQIMGKFGLTDVTLDQDLSLTYDGSYIEYLRHALAQYMCSDYGIIFNPQSEQIMRKIVHQLRYVSPPDLSMKKTSILTANNGGLSYADVNVGKGWRPS